MQLPAVKLQADDGKHENGEKEQQADLEERHHGLHDGLQHDLQAWEGKRKSPAQLSTRRSEPGTPAPTSPTARGAG